MGKIGLKLSVVFLVFNLILLPISIIGNPKLNQTSLDRVYLGQNENYTPMEQIHIWSNDDFANFNFPGSGTQEDPYRIEGYEITNSEDDLIFISDTDVYFIIRDNLLLGDNADNQYGIRFNNVQNGLIEDNIITEANDNGIQISNSENIIFRYNVVSNNFNWGINLYQTSNIQFNNNFISSNGFEGVGSYTSTNNLWINNTILDNSDHGVRFEFSNSNIFKSNFVSLNGASGIWLGEAHNNLIQQNNLSKNAAGIEIASSMSNLIIENDIVSNIVGVSLFPGERNNITNNRITDNEDAGIDLGNAFENNIEYNFIDRSANTGINLAGGEDNKIHNNFISNGGNGLTISGGSTTDEITCNLFEENLQSGIALSENTHFELIEQNDFVDNQNSPQATDDGNSNSFQNNYWNEFDIQTQSTRYEIAGSSDNADNTVTTTRNTNQQDINSICFAGLKSSSIGLPIESSQIESLTNDDPIITDEDLVFPISNSAIAVLLILLLTVPSVIFFYQRNSNTSYEMARREEVSQIGFDEYEAKGSINRTPVSGLCKKCGTYSAPNVTSCPSCRVEFS